MMRTVRVYNVAVYVPVEYARDFLDKVTTQIPQLFGNYDSCAWWSSEGTGQFRPLEGANPAQGDVGKVERCPEIRLEFSLPQDDAVLAHMVEQVIRPAHPWEEPVILITEALAARP